MKIIFKDTGEIVEVTTSQQLANTKVRVTPETSRSLQEHLIGYDILCGRLRWKEVEREDVDALIIYESKYFYLMDAIELFENHAHREFEILSPERELTPSQQKELAGYKKEEEELLNLAAEKVREIENNGWISVLDRLPEFGSYVLAYDPKREPCSFRTVGWFRTWASDVNFAPTHWEPLPESPKTSNF